MKNSLIFTLIVTNKETGRKENQVHYEVDRFLFMEHLQAPKPDPWRPRDFDALIEAMKKRESRKDIVREIVRTMSLKLCEQIEDQEGWHGEERQQSSKLFQ